MTLINSVLSSLPLYFFSFYKAPRKVLEEMIRLQRQFLWAGGIERRAVSWVKWSAVCKPKRNGGLGIKNLEAFNIALLAKWEWRLITEPGAIWAGLIWFRYGDLSFWSLYPEEYGAGQVKKHSIWWRDLCSLGIGFTS